MINKNKLKYTIIIFVVIWGLLISACYTIFDIRIGGYRIHWDDLFTWLLPFAFLTLFILILLALLTIACLGREQIIKALKNYYTK